MKNVFSKNTKIINSIVSNIFYKMLKTLKNFSFKIIENISKKLEKNKKNKQ